MRRKAAVAGHFYPAHATAIKRQIESLITETTPQREVMGAVAPHAGYVYSGPVAVKVYQRIKAAQTILLLGPNHGAGMDMAAPPKAAIMAQGTWDMPNGEADINLALSSLLMNETDLLEDAPWAHEWEHSLEVQVPFLQYFNGDIQIVPIIIWNLADEEITSLAAALARGLKKYGRPVTVIASTDFSHYIPHELAKLKDAMAIEKIIALDGMGLVEVVRRERISMCGYLATAVVIETLKALGATKAELVDYKTSGDVSGDYASVVGYGGLVIS